MSAILSIYNEDDVTLLDNIHHGNLEEAATTNSRFTLKIYPNLTMESQNFCWVVLEVKYYPGYPQILPGLRIIKEQCSKEITDKHIEEIEREVTAKAKELV